MQHMSGCTHIPKCSCIIAILYAFIIIAKAFHGVEFYLEGLKWVWKQRGATNLVTPPHQQIFWDSGSLTSSRGKD